MFTILEKRMGRRKEEDEEKCSYGMEKLLIYLRNISITHIHYGRRSIKQ